MQLLAPTEEKMWEKIASTNHVKMSDQEINAKYEKGEQRKIRHEARNRLIFMHVAS